MQFNNLLKTISLHLLQRRCYRKQMIRVRFAPSPTGDLHLGGLRTALFNYLFARKNDGCFILRIEDTDQTRLKPGSMERLRDDLIWAGIIPDEDPIRGGPKGPYLQSKRLEIYQEHVEKLIANGSAYYCFCTEQRLNLLRREAVKTGAIPKYDNRCRSLDPQTVSDKLKKGQSYCIRFKLTSELKSFNDLVYGEMQATNCQEPDPVIMKSDGFPTYHFANVVDDHLMEISHVLRGVEWQISTPKHIEIYNAFGWTPPYFAHLPLILNSDHSKLSKRQGDIKIDSFKYDGIFPLALLNYITFAGGGFDRAPGSLVCYSYEELIKQFNLSRINVHSSKLAPEKLLELNRLEIHKLLEDENNYKLLISKIRKIVTDKFPERIKDETLQLDDDHILMVLKWVKNRISRLQDLVDSNLAFIWVMPSIERADVDPKISNSMEMLIKELGEVKDFSKSSVVAFLKDFAKNNEVEFPLLMKTLRSALSGLDRGPSVGEMMEILGKNTTINRLNRYLQ